LYLFNVGSVNLPKSTRNSEFASRCRLLRDFLGFVGLLDDQIMSKILEKKDWVGQLQSNKRQIVAF
jgi:hypothetical protein